MSGTEIFSQYRKLLSVRDGKLREKAARQLRHYMESEAMDLPPEEYQKLLNKFNQVILDMLQEHDVNAKVGGILAMDQLLDLFYLQSSEHRFLEFANALVRVFESNPPNNDISALVEGTRVLGHLVSVGGTTLLEYVETYQMGPALQWLQSDSFQTRRHAAVLILKELALNCPTMFYRHIETFLDVIWNGLSDTKAEVRVQAAASLQAALLLVQQRESRQKQQWYSRLQDNVENGLIDGSPEAVHGAFLIENELLRNTGEFMYQYFDKVCKTILVPQYVNNRSLVVRKSVVALIPRLAKFNSSAFVANYLQRALAILLQLVSRPNILSSDAFTSLGRLAEAVGPALAKDSNVLEQILSYICNALVVEKKKELDSHNQALTCLRRLVTHAGPAITRVDFTEILTRVFDLPLNRYLIDTLTTFVVKLPSERSNIQRTLFHTLHSILVRSAVDASDMVASPSSPSRRGGQNHKLSKFISTAKEKFVADRRLAPGVGNGGTSSATVPEWELTLALQTLGTFDFTGNRHIPIVQFVHDVVVRFLDNENAYVRKAAAVSCCKLLLPPGEDAPTRGEAAIIVSSVVERLLTVGIADMEPEIRARVLSSLDARFDSLLCQPDALRSLFLAVNDEVFGIRETAMNMLGRLSQRAPATVMPALRQTLVQLLAELHFSVDSRSMEESARLLTRLIQGSAHLVRPYLVPILTALVHNLRNTNVGVETAVLATLGELCVVGGREVLPYQDQLLPEVIAVLREQSAPQKLLVAIRTLGQMVRSTGYVVRPYFQYPDLLPLLVQVLRRSGDVNWPLRREASRTLGILGALDPYKLRLIQLHSRSLQPGECMPEETYLNLVVNLHLPPLQLSARPGSTLTETTQEMRNHIDGLEDDIREYLGKGSSANLGFGGDRPGRLGESVGTQSRGRTSSTDSDRRPSSSTMPIGAIPTVTDLTVAPPEEILPSLVDNPNLYFPTMAVNGLVRILNDPRTRQHINITLQAVMFICKNLGKSARPFLGVIVPSLIKAIHVVSDDLREVIFGNLANLCSIMGKHMQPHVDANFVAVVHQYWDRHLEAVLRLVEALAKSLKGDFPLYLSDFVPLMLRVIRNERKAQNRPKTILILATIKTLGPSLEDYIHFILPVLLKLIQEPVPDRLSRVTALHTLLSLVKQLNVSTFSSRIIHPLTRVIASEGGSELSLLALEVLSCLVYQLGNDFVVFVPMVNQHVAGIEDLEDRREFEKYQMLVARILKDQPLPLEEWVTKQSEQENEDDDEEETEWLRRPMNEASLKKAWEVSQRSTKEDWNEWMRVFSVELLRESPSTALHGCHAVASVYQTLARELFNAAFVSCWHDLSEASQESLVTALETAFRSPNLPPEILLTLLNLAEFMEHDDQPLPIDIPILGGLAEKVHSYAKALHYKELEFHKSPSPDGVEALITINNKLNQPEAAVGILKFAQSHISDINVKPSWYEKLERWDEALDAYKKAEKTSSPTLETQLGMMRCLRALGEWKELGDRCSDLWDKIYSPSLPISQRLIAPHAVREELCTLAASAAVGLERWEEIPRYIESEFDPVQKQMFLAVLALQDDKFQIAQSHVDKAREQLDASLRALISESYERAYMPDIVLTQMLGEIEEVIELRHMQHQHQLAALMVNQPGSSASVASLTNWSGNDRTAHLKRMWSTRMMGSERDVNVWQHLLVERMLLLRPEEDRDTWLAYSSLCRESGIISLAKKALIKVGAKVLLESLEKNPYSPMPIVLHGPNALKPHPKVAFTLCKALWTEGKENIALYQLSELADTLDRRADPLPEMIHLRVRAHLKLGQWLQSKNENMGGSDMRIFDKVLESLQIATRLAKDSYKPWHEWALVNFRLTSMANEMGPRSRVTNHAVAAMNGFFRSIAIGQQKKHFSSLLQDVLRLLTLWFTYGHMKEVHDAMAAGNQAISTETWLHVLPQLIARIHTSNSRMNALLQGLLLRIGMRHPQGLIYPIMVAYKSTSPHRKSAAQSVLDEMRRHSNSLVREAELVSHELIRVAIQWPEMWHEALEEAARYYFSEDNIDAMIAVLQPLHEMLQEMGKRDTPTLREIAFHQAFARDLSEAREWTDQYQKSRDENHLHQAWDIYYQVFRRISKQFSQMTSLELENTAPNLLAASELSLAVPGTYQAGKEPVRIRRFGRTITVISSKQRPRKITIHGSDGKNYVFLLKGHEDLRQDERVMQLFGLINTLLQNDRDTSKRNLAIERYAVLPLSHTAGMIGWVPHCDTLHQLIRDYRDARRIPVNVETRLCSQFCPDFEKLEVMKKVEIFLDTFAQTTGQDLYRVLWLKSQNSEVWLERRKNYTRSLALMSMVGYILGLGDRHPSNLMLERVTGKIVHIDFGDCFEVAMQREKYPENVPFRLTRMMTSAMEVSGIEGNFRFTCEGVMKVLRYSRDSLMAALEAFVHDPLINWRLLAPTQVSPSHAHDEDGQVRKSEEDPSNGQRATVDRDSASMSGPISDADLDVSEAGSVDGRGSHGMNGDAIKRGADMMRDRVLGQRGGKDIASEGADRYGKDVWKADGDSDPTANGQDPRLQKAGAGKTSKPRTEKQTGSVNEFVGADMNVEHGRGSIPGDNGEVLNARAVEVITRVQNKLTGRDFDPNQQLPVAEQVDRLIQQATSVENLCQLYIGWCPMW